MSESQSGYEFLKRFQEEQKGENASFNVFSDYLIALREEIRKDTLKKLGE